MKSLTGTDGRVVFDMVKGEERVKGGEYEYRAVTPTRWDDFVDKSEFSTFFFSSYAYSLNFES